ncbi:MAG: hypothetical protein QG615_1757 [Nitrospirota bacterium]|nr:hypothetical protein [Nitrospirota bacterium]
MLICPYCGQPHDLAEACKPPLARVAQLEDRVKELQAQVDDLEAMDSAALRIAQAQIKELQQTEDALRAYIEARTGNWDLS